MSETVVLKKVPPISSETKSKDPDDPTADLGTNLKIIQDPLNLSNVNPEQEEKIRKLKIHKFKVNGQKAEMNLEQKARVNRTINSKANRNRKVVANLDLREEIPIPKIVLEMPKPGEKVFWTPKKIIDVRDSIMGSTRGYDLKIQWGGVDKQGKPYEDSWEPSNNITKASMYLFNQFKKTETFKDYMKSRSNGKVEEPVPKPKKVRFVYEDKDKPPTKEHKVDGSLAGRTRSGKLFGGAKNSEVPKALSANTEEISSKHPTINLVDDESPEDFAKSRFGEYFGQVPTYVNKEQQDKIFAAFVQADFDDMDQRDSYEDHTDFTSFEDDDVSIEKCIHQSIDSACYTYNFNEQEIDELSQNLKGSTKGGKPRGNSSAAETSRVQGMQGGSPSEKAFTSSVKIKDFNPDSESKITKDSKSSRSIESKSSKVSSAPNSQVHLDENEIKKPPDFSNHPRRTPTNQEVNSFIQESLEKVMERIGIDEEAPKNFNQMVKGKYEKEFREAMDVEIKSIMDHGTFEEVYCPEGVVPITCRWVYDFKRNEFGKVIKFKARLVVQGYKQQFGIDYEKTFSSTAQIRSFRIMVALSVLYDLPVYQYDIKNAFLNSKMDKEVFVHWPPGYENLIPKKKGTVAKLLKALYGLHQCSRLWQQTLYKALGEVGFVVCKTDSGVLHLKDSKGLFAGMITCWVDDLGLMVKDDKIRVKLEECLAKHFTISAKGLLKLYVGIVVEKGKDGSMTLHQEPYHEKAIKKFLEDSAKPYSVPGNPVKSLSRMDCPITEEEKRKIDYPYMNATGTQLYSAICTRPDIFFQTINLAKFNSNPGQIHVEASKNLFRYLKGTKGEGIKFKRPKNWDGRVEIKAFVDSDWAGCVDTRRSTIGFIIQIAGGPISWKSKTMKTIAQSSCEAEFMGLTEVCKELMWLCNFLEELGIPFHTPKIYCDSQSAIHWSEDPIEHARNKHMEVKYYYVRDCVTDGKVRIFKILTTYQLADMMTKPLEKQPLDRLKPAAMGHQEPVMIARKSELPQGEI